MILDLVLTHKWYDKIASGEKKIEYREIKPYWTKRLFSREWGSVRFRKGYTLISMEFKIQGISITKEQNDLKLPECYAIILGERIK